MDIDVLARQVRELNEWKAKIAPMLEDMMPEWEAHLARKVAHAAEEGQAAAGDPNAEAAALEK